MEKTMVKIDMEKPKDCQDCRFCFFDDYSSKFKCFATEPSRGIGECELLEPCPLVEVKDDD